MSSIWSYFCLVFLLILWWVFPSFPVSPGQEMRANFSMEDIDSSGNFFFLAEWRKFRISVDADSRKPARSFVFSKYCLAVSALLKNIESQDQGFRQRECKDNDFLKTCCLQSSVQRALYHWQLGVGWIKIDPHSVQPLFVIYISRLPFQFRLYCIFKITFISELNGFSHGLAQRYSK